MHKSGFLKRLSNHELYKEKTQQESIEKAGKHLDVILDEFEKLFMEGESLTLVNFGKFHNVENKAGTVPSNTKNNKDKKKRIPFESKRKVKFVLADRVVNLMNNKGK